jgi:hypothetical protein
MLMLVLAVVLRVVQPVGEATTTCPTVEFSGIQKHRADFGKVVFLFGDSIMRGWSLATFTPAPNHPLWCLRSPGAVLATLRSENALGSYTYVTVNGSELAEPSVIEGYIEDGTIRDGDIIVVQDAGGHPHPPRTYQERLLGVRRAATLDHAITVVVLTTPDYIDIARHPESAPNRWSVEVAGMTHNAALRQGATEPIPGTVGRTIMVDWQCHAAPVRENLLQEQGLDIFHSDGIHPNILGQLQLVGLVLDAIGVPVERTRPVEQVAIADIGNLDHEATLKSKTWSKDHAVRWVNRLLTQPHACP